MVANVRDWDGYNIGNASDFSKLGFIRRNIRFNTASNRIALPPPTTNEYIQRQSSANIGGSGHIRGFHHSFALYIILLLPYCFHETMDEGVRCFIMRRRASQYRSTYLRFVAIHSSRICVRRRIFHIVGMRERRRVLCFV
jgi:hypothetical protein